MLLVDVIEYVIEYLIEYLIEYVIEYLIEYVYLLYLYIVIRGVIKLACYPLVERDRT